MITNFNSDKKKKDDIKLLLLVCMIIVVVVWLIAPPRNKFMQLCYVCKNAQYLIEKTFNPNVANEWVLHRNNAVYQALMDNKLEAMKEMDRAFVTMPSYVSETKLSALYKDRATLKIFYKDYKGALDDYARVKTKLDLTDRLKVALLYKMNGNRKYALSYCNSILDVDPTAYAGYACIADIYSSAGRPDTAVKVYDLLIDRAPNKAVYYVDRAKYKQESGDIEGYGHDLNKAKQIAPGMEVSPSSIIEDTISPRKLTLQIVKS